MGEGQLKPGEQLDKYTIVELLAAGGMGEVYLASHRFTKRQVALKVLRLSRAGKEDFRDRMQAEAEVLCELRHPNIVQVYDADMTSTGVVWIAMERLVGLTLRDFGRRGPLPLPHAFRIAAEIADGVGAAHQIKVWHRDLKPENVFITTKREVKILDLGTAKFTDRGVKTTDAMRLLGTPYYMSPEHLLGEKVDGRTDIYALALMVYELLVGHHAFAHGKDNDGLPSGQQIGDLQIHATPAPLTRRIQGFPEYAEEVVFRGMAKMREERWQTMAELGAALRAARKRFLAEAEAQGNLALYKEPETLGSDAASPPPQESREKRFRTMRMEPGGQVVAPLSGPMRETDPGLAPTQELSPQTGGPRPPAAAPARKRPRHPTPPTPTPKGPGATRERPPRGRGARGPPPPAPPRRRPSRCRR